MPPHMRSACGQMFKGLHMCKHAHDITAAFVFLSVCAASWRWLSPRLNEPEDSPGVSGLQFKFCLQCMGGSCVRSCGSWLSQLHVTLMTRASWGAAGSIAPCSQPTERNTSLTPGLAQSPCSACTSELRKAFSALQLGAFLRYLPRRCRCISSQAPLEALAMSSVGSWWRVGRLSLLPLERPIRLPTLKHWRARTPGSFIL